jgi:hypothetical protein
MSLWAEIDWLWYATNDNKTQRFYLPGRPLPCNNITEQGFPVNTTVTDLNESGCQYRFAQNKVFTELWFSWRKMWWEEVINISWMSVVCQELCLEDYAEIPFMFSMLMVDGCHSILQMRKLSLREDKWHAHDSVAIYCERQHGLSHFCMSCKQRPGCPCFERSLHMVDSLGR